MTTTTTTPIILQNEGFHRAYVAPLLEELSDTPRPAEAIAEVVKTSNALTEAWDVLKATRRRVDAGDGTADDLATLAAAPARIEAAARAYAEALLALKTDVAAVARYRAMDLNAQTAGTANQVRTLAASLSGATGETRRGGLERLRALEDELLPVQARVQKLTTAANVVETYASERIGPHGVPAYAADQRRQASQIAR